jgi:hypothetical protein
LWLPGFIYVGGGVGGGVEGERIQKQLEYMRGNENKTLHSALQTSQKKLFTEWHQHEENSECVHR